jgi:hypothetical protein
MTIFFQPDCWMPPFYLAPCFATESGIYFQWKTSVHSTVIVALPTMFSRVPVPEFPKLNLWPAPVVGEPCLICKALLKKSKMRLVISRAITIAVMGCIVNGPGEMADADFGYVGSGPGKIDLYVGKNRVKSAIPENDAVDRLVDLIQEEGKWIDP